MGGNLLTKLTEHLGQNTERSSWPLDSKGSSSAAVHTVIDPLTAAPPGTRGFFDLFDSLRWRAGMVAQLAVESELRRAVRDKLATALEEFQPDILAAHSLGTLITYDLFRNDRRGRDILANGVYITFGSQINNLFARSRLFPGQIQVPNVRFWYHLFNPQDLEFIKKTRKFTGNYNTLKSIARFRAMEAHKLVVDALARLQLSKNYRIKAQMSAGEKGTDIVADRNGENYEIHMPELWLKSIGNEHWISRDEGQSWKPTQPDTYLLAVLESPLTAQFQGPLGASRPRVEEVDRKELGDETMVHLRVLPSGLDSSYASIVPEYWITRTATDAVLQKFAGPTLFFKTVVFLRAEYTQWGQIREISKPEVGNSQRKQE